MEGKEHNLKPMTARVTKVYRENPEVKTFRLKFLDRKDELAFSFLPGQFAMFSLPGIGEVPISLCSPSFEKDYLEISIRAAGNVTGAMFRMRNGDTIGIRGPFGKGFPMERLRNRDIVIVAGGIGFPPLGSVIDYIGRHRDDFGRLWVLYGAKTPKDLVFRKRARRWRLIRDIEYLVTVEEECRDWKGCRGRVTDLFTELRIKPERTVALSCGPPVMMKFAALGLEKRGVRDSDIYLSLERMMQCGIGKCGHCGIGDKYVCTDGPVFSYSEIKQFLEEAWHP